MVATSQRRELGILLFVANRSLEERAFDAVIAAVNDEANLVEKEHKIDLIRWNDAGQITDFKVMVRPLKAVNMLHQQMGAMLDRLKQGQAQQQGRGPGCGRAYCRGLRPGGR